MDFLLDMHLLLLVGVQLILSLRNPLDIRLFLEHRLLMV